MRILFPLFCLLLTSTFLGEVIGNDRISDAELSKRFSGSWVVDPEHHQSMPSITKYHADGTSVFQLFSSSACREVVLEARGTWEINHSILTITVTKSSDQSIFQIGDVIQDKVISVDGDMMILESADGGLLYRRRQEFCNTGIGV